MTGTGRRFAVIANAALDLRRRPDHRSELRSQLLAGEIVRRRKRSRDGRWWEVVNFTDGYAGWVRTWGIVPATRAEAERWRRRATARVLAPFVEVHPEPGRGPLLAPLCWNGRVVPLRSTQGRRLIELPDGRRGWIPRTAVEVTTPVARAAMGARALARRIQGLLGTPYLWGGRTPLGLDCSSFTQLVLAEQGIALPRDAALQFSHCARLGPNASLQLGDLVFFGPRRSAPAHVGIALGSGYFAHARGTVRVNSLDVDNPLYDKGLADQFRGYGRPPRRPPRARFA
jgi:hypothetical protein